MTKDNIDQYQHAFDALRKGRLQVLTAHDVWMDIHSTDFCFPPDRYREKPEPLTLWVNVYPDGTYHPHRSREAADKSQSRFLDRIRCVKMVEATE